MLGLFFHILSWVKKTVFRDVTPCTLIATYRPAWLHIILIAMRTTNFTIFICVQMIVLPAASQFIGVWHLAVALQAVGLVPPHPHANSQSLLMERRPVRAHALQQGLSVQAVGLLPGKAKTVYLFKLYISQWMAVYGQHLLKSLTVIVL